MAETVRVENQSGVSVRAFSHGEESALLEILRDAFGSFADVARTKAVLSSKRFDPDGCFVAEENGVPIGWLAVTSLPRDKWFVIRYLSIRRARLQTTVAESLLSRAITYVESKGQQFLRATTPAIQPYVDAYQKFGFKPLRRDFRISWQTDDVPRTEDLRLASEEISDETVDSAGNLLVLALSPYWDWRTEEHKPVGVVGIIPDYYEPGVAWFRGAFVLPEHRGKRVGSALMSEISTFAKTLGQRKMVVYTFSYLDSLAPGAQLYLKTGGKIEAEYLQLARMRDSAFSGK